MNHTSSKSCCVPKRAADIENKSADHLIGPDGPVPGDRRSGENPRQGLVLIEGARFQMGTNDKEGFREDGEGPARLVSVDSFYTAPTVVTNREFADFVRDTAYITDAERYGYSFVFHLQISRTVTQTISHHPTGLSWWWAVEGASWQRPEGPGSHIYERLDHPVVHVSWADACAYCQWAGQRLPTEAEWEFAARGGLAGKKYPWGDELQIDGRSQCNIWRGDFPDTVEQGWQVGTVPARSFEPNGYGLYNVSGNIWEWCRDGFTPAYHAQTGASNPEYTQETGRRSMRGGSFLCHDSYCNRYRVAARNSNTPSSSASNCGFRVAADLG